MMQVPPDNNLVVGASLAGVAGVIIWAASELVKVRDLVRQVHQALFGVEKQLGVIDTVRDNTQRIDTLESRVDHISNRM